MILKVVEPASKGEIMFKRILARWMAIPVVLMGATVLAVISVPSAASATPEYGPLQNYGGKCLTNGGSTANNAVITQYSCNGSTNQNWEYTNSDQWKNQDSGKCLSNGTSSMGNSAVMSQYTCNSSSDEKWTQNGQSNGWFTEVNGKSGKCLTNGGSTGNSTDITQYTCNGSTNQDWD